MSLLEKVAAGSFTFKETLVKDDAGVPGSIQELVGKLTGIISILAGVLAFLYLIYSGFLYLTANGNPDQAKKGQQGIINAIIGLAIISLAYFIVSAVIGSLKEVGSA